MAIADVLASIFEYSFLWRSFVAAILIGSLCSLLGVFVVLKGLSFAGAESPTAPLPESRLHFSSGQIRL